MSRMEDIAHLARRAEHDEPDWLSGEAPEGSGVAVVVLVYAAAIAVGIAFVAAGAIW